MNVGLIRRIVIWLSVAMGVAGLVFITACRMRGLSVPLWAWLMFTYGGMVSVVLPMDWVGKQATRFRADADALKSGPRPRPRPMPSGDVNQRVAPVEVRYIPEGDVHLERVSAVNETDLAELQTRIDAAVTEVEALEDRRPELDEAGHVANVSALNLLHERTVYPFFILVRQQRCGICIVRVNVDAGRAELLMLYVESGWRRRHVARHVINRLSAFLDLLMADYEVQVKVSSANGRARQFMAGAGYVETGEAEPSTDSGQTRVQIWVKTHGHHA